MYAHEILTITNRKLFRTWWTKQILVGTLKIQSHFVNTNLKLLRKIRVIIESESNLKFFGAYEQLIMLHYAGS